MYRVTRIIDFCYGHRLLNYDGKCKYLHGHNGRAEIVLVSDTLDERGMVLDFTEIKRVVNTWVVETLDHLMVLHHDDAAVPLFREQGEPMDSELSGSDWLAQRLSSSNVPPSSDGPQLSISDAGTATAKNTRTEMLVRMVIS